MNIPHMSPQQVEFFFLILIRVAAIVALTPVIGDRTIPAGVKGGLCLFIALLVFPLVPNPGLASPDLLSLALKMTGEVFIGVVIGFASRLLFAGIQMAGQLIGFQMGFSIVNIVDPVSSQQVSIIAEFQYLVASLIFLATNAHHIFLAAILESYTSVPVLGFHLSGPLVDSLLAVSRDMFVVSVKISAPLIAALLFTNLGLGLIARTVPQINIFIVGFPLQIAIGLIGLAVTMPIFVTLVERMFSGMEGTVGGLLRLMG